MSCLCVIVRDLVVAAVDIMMTEKEVDTENENVNESVAPDTETAAERGEDSQTHCTSIIIINACYCSCRHSLVNLLTKLICNYYILIIPLHYCILTVCNTAFQKKYFIYFCICIFTFIYHIFLKLHEQNLYVVLDWNR